MVWESYEFFSFPLWNFLYYLLFTEEFKYGPKGGCKQLLSEEQKHNHQSQNAPTCHQIASQGNLQQDLNVLAVRVHNDLLTSQYILQFHKGLHPVHDIITAIPLDLIRRLTTKKFGVSL